MQRLARWLPIAAVALAVTVELAMPSSALARVHHRHGAFHRHHHHHRRALTVYASRYGALRGRRGEPRYAPPAPIVNGLFDTGLFNGTGLLGIGALGL